MNKKATAASLSLRERVSAEQTGEGLALNAFDSSPSSVASRATFSRRGEGLLSGNPTTAWEVKR